MALEVERKFLLDGYPEDLITDGTLEVQKVYLIDQTYLALSDGEELRVRRLTDAATGLSEYVLTYKSGFGLVRQEVEQPISGKLYEELMSKVRLNPLVKERTIAKMSNGLVVEIDRYSQFSLTVVEVEFASEEDAMNFAPPKWFGEEISTSKLYSNKQLWKQLNHA
jgi:CYTH domain-containing protein